MLVLKPEVTNVGFWYIPPSGPEWDELLDQVMFRTLFSQSGGC